MTAGFAVPYVNLPAQYASIQAPVTEAVGRVLRDGSFILRKDVDEFERRVADYLGVRHAIGVNSGTDALFLALAASDVGPGDEVVTVSHTYVATVAAIHHCGATPVLVDIGDDFNLDPDRVEEAITDRTKAIVPVHLNGRCCEMDRIRDIADRRGLAVIEDAAQAIGARYRDRFAGAFGRAGCFSLHPMKCLGCAGDGGFVATDSDALSARLRLLRDHGQETKERLVCFGYNSRLDNLQAAILNVKLDHLDRWNARRRELAAAYDASLSDRLALPPAPEENGAHHDVYSGYVVRTPRRDALCAFLRENGIEAVSTWPVPLHRQPGLSLARVSLPKTEAASATGLALPIAPETTDDQLGLVVDAVARFFETDRTGSTATP